MSLQKELCLICALPTADGAILAVHLDKEKLETWILNVCGHELAEEIEDHDLICYFCLWHAEFQWKFDEMVDESLVWWPRNSENLDDAAKELRKNYFEGKLEQCWVQLKKIELPKSADGEEGQIVEAEIRPRRWKCICCGKRYKYSYDLSKHMKKIHKEAIRCENRTCATYFHTLEEKEKHTKNVHESTKNREKVECSFCGKEFEGPQCYKQHVRKPFGTKRCVLLSYSENQHSYKKFVAAGIFVLFLFFKPFELFPKMSSNELLNNLWIACNILFAPIVALIVVIIELIFCGLITDGSTKEVEMNERNSRRERRRFWRAMTIENRLLSGIDSHTDSTLSQDGSDSTEEDEDMNRRENNFIRFMCLPEPGLFCIRISSMSDLQRLSLAKSRLNNLRKNKSLFDLTAKKIVKSFETFISDEREDDMKRIQRLPTLRE
ncbi:Hypothetical predicted protein [Cloeon dipterum]|uniref:C2H2-type domain-containing protein n=1 Tax=Cloeon dipterum TaxID=197152 RepID=A0A8S1E636_9INSE|nr:Hypothetical predicted protein [Cloeon dipterum]